MGRKHEKVKTLFIGLLAGLSNGFFGSGGGSLAVPLMTGLLGMKEKKAHATAVSVIMFLTGASLFVYFKHGYLALDTAWKVVPGGIAGGIIGGVLLKKCPVNVLKKVFGSLLLYAGYRMIKSA